MSFHKRPDVHRVLFNDIPVNYYAVYVSGFVPVMYYIN